MMRASILELSTGISVGTRTYRNAQACQQHGVVPVVRKAKGQECLVTYSDGRQAMLWAGPTGRIHQAEAKL